MDVLWELFQQALALSVLILAIIGQVQFPESFPQVFFSWTYIDTMFQKSQSFLFLIR